MKIQYILVTAFTASLFVSMPALGRPLPILYEGDNENPSEEEAAPEAPLCKKLEGYTFEDLTEKFRHLDGAEVTQNPEKTILTVKVVEEGIEFLSIFTYRPNHCNDFQLKRKTLYWGPNEYPSELEAAPEAPLCKKLRGLTFEALIEKSRSLNGVEFNQNPEKTTLIVKQFKQGVVFADYFSQDPAQCNEFQSRRKQKPNAEQVKAAEKAAEEAKSPIQRQQEDLAVNAASSAPSRQLTNVIDYRKMAGWSEWSKQEKYDNFIELLESIPNDSFRRHEGGDSVVDAYAIKQLYKNPIAFKDINNHKYYLVLSRISSSSGRLVWYLSTENECKQVLTWDVRRDIDHFYVWYGIEWLAETGRIARFRKNEKFDPKNQFRVGVQGIINNFTITPSEYLEKHIKTWRNNKHESANDSIVQTSISFGSLLWYTNKHHPSVILTSDNPLYPNNNSAQDLLEMEEILLLSDDTPEGFYIIFHTDEFEKTGEKFNALSLGTMDNSFRVIGTARDVTDYERFSLPGPTVRVEVDPEKICAPQLHKTIANRLGGIKHFAENNGYMTDEEKLYTQNPEFLYRKFLVRDLFSTIVGAIQYAQLTNTSKENLENVIMNLVSAQYANLFQFMKIREQHGTWSMDDVLIDSGFGAQQVFNDKLVLGGKLRPTFLKYIFDSKITIKRLIEDEVKIMGKIDRCMIEQKDLPPSQRQKDPKEYCLISIEKNP